MQQEDSGSSSAVSFCPSFNAYSSDKLVDVAARVTREFKDEEWNSKALVEEDEAYDDDGDDFEFVSIGKNLDASELFFDGQIRQVFPVFNRDLLLNHGDYSCYTTTDGGKEETHVPEGGCPLEKLFIGDDRGGPRGPPSSSSSDADEPDEAHNVMFCVWSPRRNPVESSPSRCKKSNSTGSSSSSTSTSSSSKKWLKFRDLLKRSNSEGKDSFVFLSKPKSNKAQSKEKKNSSEAKSGKAASSPVSAHAAFYVKNRSIREGDKKRSYLPYRQDLVGLFSSYPHGSIPKPFPSF
ncbi:Nipped-B-like protein [Melia azedarach]|uniref:Nipped-B-like protein n=1 Tax=Melia azedarach TaxID=155640 RepID=A0ACC1Z0H8_MELAZ|nr:Nipped-B-like protein [Melia azedarach]